MHRYWTTADTGTMRQMAKAGKTASQIGRALGRNATTVINRARIHGVKLPAARRYGRKWTPQEVQRMFDLFALGYNAVKVADVLGREKTSVYSKLSMEKKRRSESWHVEWSQAEIETLRDMAEDGCTINQVSARLGRTHASVRWRARASGISFASNPGAPIGHAMNKQRELAYQVAAKKLQQRPYEDVAVVRDPRRAPLPETHVFSDNCLADA